MIKGFKPKQWYWFFLKVTAWEKCKGIKWMNEKALPKRAYEPTPVEHIANIATHGIWIVPSILAISELYNRSYNYVQVLSSLIYGATLFALFVISTLFHSVFYCQRNRIKWMNEKALPKRAYEPTPVEHIANIATHGIWIVPSILAISELYNRSYNYVQVLSSLIYGATLFALFVISTLFHSVFYCQRNRQLKDVLHRCDRAMIYIFIAGSYFPWLTILLPNEGWSSEMKWFVWFLAVLGITYQQVFHEKYKMLETIFYILMGVLPALTIISEHEFSGLTELKIGGLLYIIGVFFFKSDGSIPCAHAIWHLFVVMAAGVHYYAILNYLYPEKNSV